MPEEGAAFPARVVATAGHVDHGKSTLIVRLTGIDPDRWEEEKRRGLTIDLGFAWTTLPSGREVGFVDVPGHERFVRNMLAGIGPVRLVLFVVAADEGWKPQSEEHLAIADVLGADGGVVALTKRDLVDESTARRRAEEVRDRLEGTVLAGARVVPVSGDTGAGLDDLRAALDDLLAAAPAPEETSRPRLFVDRSFSITGAGTVVTGTLTGGPLVVGDEVEVQPAGTRARIRSLQSHKRSLETAHPVSRVAVNLAGTSREQVQRGDALVRPGSWRPTGALEVRLTAIRGLDHPLTARGAFKAYLGSAERDASLRLYGIQEVPALGTALARLRLSHPVVAAVGDRLVLREAGRGETVAGGVVLDQDPPRRAGADWRERLERRERASPDELPRVVVAERSVVRAADLEILTGLRPVEVPGATRLGPWWLADEALDRLVEAATERLAGFHAEHPLRPGLEQPELRRAMIDAVPALTPVLERELAVSILHLLERRGTIAREGPVVRLAEHRVSLGEREEEASRMVDEVAAGEPTPPDVPALLARGYPRDLISAACRVGRLVAVGKDLVFTPAFAARAASVAAEEAARPEGLTVSAFRKLLGTTRKYALPLLEHLDAGGVTRRDGDVRRPGRS